MSSTPTGIVSAGQTVQPRHGPAAACQRCHAISRDMPLQLPAGCPPAHAWPQAAATRSRSASACAAPHQAAAASAQPAHSATPHPADQPPSSAARALCPAASLTSAAIQRCSDWMRARRQHGRGAAYAGLGALAQHLGHRFRQPRKAHHQCDRLWLELLDARGRELAAALEQPWPVRVGGSRPDAASCCSSCCRLCHQSRPTSRRRIR